MVTIKKFTEKECFASGCESQDVVECKFHDGTVVPLCKDHLFRKLKDLNRKPEGKAKRKGKDAHEDQAPEESHPTVMKATA